MTVDAQTQARVANVEQRMRERGVVDVKFFKNYPEYSNLSPSQQMNELCDVIECVLDGRTRKAEPLGDSVRGGLLGAGSPSPITLSPVTRCGGGRLGEDHNEEQQKGGTTAP